MAQKLYEESNIQAIAQAIRDKNGLTTTYKTSEMAAAIAAITTGGGGDSGIPEEAFHITGMVMYKFAGGSWDWFIEQYGDQITTSDLTKANMMFQQTRVSSIPFELNFDGNDYNMDLEYMFSNARNLEYIPDINISEVGDSAPAGYVFDGCESLKSVPYIFNLYPDNVNNMFRNCSNLREIPEDYVDTWCFDRLQESAYASVVNIFESCYSLRSYPKKLLEGVCGIQSSYYYMYPYCLFLNCYALDEVVDIPVPTALSYGNPFYQMVANCYRLKRFTFALNPDTNEPYEVNWRDVTIDLSNWVGYCPSWSKEHITNFNSGISSDKEVEFSYQYQSLKDDPDWFTADIDYSRYNRTSAVETINSLPDTSSGGGTNTIQFSKAGASTDGGSIYTMTNEEIAVAAAKGWTVTFA